MYDIKLTPNKHQRKTIECKILSKLNKTLKLLICAPMFLAQNNRVLDIELSSFITTTRNVNINKLFPELKNKIHKQLALSPQDSETIPGLQKKCADSGSTADYKNNKTNCSRYLRDTCTNQEYRKNCWRSQDN